MANRQQIFLSHPSNFDPDTAAAGYHPGDVASKLVLCSWLLLTSRPYELAKMERLEKGALEAQLVCHERSESNRTIFQCKLFDRDSCGPVRPVLSGVMRLGSPLARTHPDRPSPADVWNAVELELFHPARLAIEELCTIQKSAAVVGLWKLFCSRLFSLPEPHETKWCQIFSGQSSLVGHDPESSSLCMRLSSESSREVQKCWVPGWVIRSISAILWWLPLFTSEEGYHSKHSSGIIQYFTHFDH